jgi:dienelactone hydrolase
MPTITRFRAAAATRRALVPFLLVVPALLGCAAPGGADPPVALLAPTAAVPTRGGVRYDATAPLQAEVKPRFDTANPPAVAPLYDVSYKGANGETVPAVYMLPKLKAEKVPTVVLLHGVGSNKEQMLLLAYALAQRGYASFLIDIPGHGKRPKIKGKEIFDLSLPEMRQMAGQTVADLRRGMDFLATRPEVDQQRIGFVGVSLGGILGGVFTADEPRIKTSVLWAAGGDWGKLITTSTHDFAKKFRKDGTPSAETVEKEMADVDPLPLAASIAPRPLLLINGDQDTIVPTVCTDEFYAAAREPKKRITLPGGHLPDLTRMATETMLFLETNLKGTSSAPSAATK